MGREGGRKENALVFKREGRGGKGAGKQLQYLWGFHIIYSILGESKPRAPLFFVYSALTKEDIDQKRH